MSEVVVPPASTTGFVFDSDNDRGRGRGHDHGGDRDWPERTAERVKSEISNSERARAEEVRDIIREINESGKENSLATEKTGAATLISVEKTAAAALLAVEKTAAATNLAIVVSTSATNLAIEKTSAAAQLYAAQNHAAALAQAAECCCELKELIREDGQKTRDLVNSIQATNLAVQLSDSKSALLALQVQLNILNGGPGNSAK